LVNHTGIFFITKLTVNHITCTKVNQYTCIMKVYSKTHELVTLKKRIFI